jgi:hypothetical protein
MMKKKRKKVSLYKNGKEESMELTLSFPAIDC